MELPYDPANPHLGIHPKAIAPLSQGAIFTPMFFTALFKIPKNSKIAKVTTVRCVVKRREHLLTCTPDYHSAFKKERTVCARGTVWTNLEDTVLREMSQIQEAFASAHLHVGFEKK